MAVVPISSPVLCCAYFEPCAVLCLFPGPDGCACFQAISSLPRWLLCLFLARDACACFQPFPVLCCAYSRPGQIRHNLVSASPTIRPTWQAPQFQTEYSWSINNSIIFTINKLRKGNSGGFINSQHKSL